LIFTPCRLAAGLSDLEIHSIAKKTDENGRKGSEGGANKIKEHWTYEVVVENKTFKEMTNLDVKYVIFFKQEKLGVKEPPKDRQQNGTFNIPSLKPHEKKSFTTDSVELAKANLVGAYHYPNGAKPNAQDTLTGIAIRVSQDGQQIAEFANPSNLAKEKWD
jgi:hypothetical protein